MKKFELIKSSDLSEKKNFDKDKLNKKNKKLCGFKKFVSDKKIILKNNLENFFETANKNKNNFFDENFEKHINKWYGTMNESSLHMKIIIYLKKEEFEKNSEKKKEILKKNKILLKNEILIKKNDFEIKNITNLKKDDILKEKKPKNFKEINEVLFLGQIKRVNFFWKGTNPSFPFIFKKIFEVDKSLYYEQLDYAEKKTKTL